IPRERQNPYRCSAPARDRSQLVERVAEELGEVWLIGVVDPAFEGDLEGGDPNLGRQARGRLADAAASQLLGDRRGERGELDQLALLQGGIRRDDARSRSRPLAPLLEQRTYRFERRRDGIDRSG